MLCSNCRIRIVSPTRKKYCVPCGANASAIWKRRQRRIWNQLGQPYWLDNWKHKTDEERRAYYRNYMRAYRQKARSTRRRA